MFKLITIISLCLAVSFVASQECVSTQSLRTTYGFGNSITTPAQSSGLNFCKSIQTTTTCCTAADVNSIQTKANTLLSNLTATVVTRDQFYAANQASALSSLQSATAATTAASTAAANAATAAATNAASALAGVASSLTNAATSAVSSSLSAANAATAAATSSLATVAGSAAAQSAVLAASFGTLVSNFTGYQQARASCVAEQVRTQAAAWCLSCDPNAATKGWSTNGGLSLGSTLCTRLENACANYVNLGLYVNAVFNAKYLTFLNGLSSTSTSSSTSTINGVTTSSGTSNIPAYSGVYPGDSTGYNCSTAAACTIACSWINSTGILNQGALLAGANPTTYQGGNSRLLEEERNLQSGSFNPDSDESGANVTFAANPGNVNPNASKFGTLSVGSVLMSVVVVVSAMML